jgi:hypothetical protein
MSIDFANKGPYLRTTRDFPQEPQQLSVELIKSYNDTSLAINARTIGLFPTRIPAINGEEWFLGGPSTKQQALRQVYIVAGTGNIAHGINFANISQFSKPSGSFTDGTNYYGLIYGSSTAIAGQVTFYLTPTNIVVQAGAGAPNISSGIIILEWLAVKLPN